MRVIVSRTGDTLDAQVSPVFGRCPVFLLVDTETMEARAIPNPAVGASGGAGVQAAQLVVREGAEAILSGNLGPNAMGVIATAGIPAYSVPSGTAREAVEALVAGRLQPLEGATVPTDYGKGGARHGPRAEVTRPSQGAPADRPAIHDE
jgi:predicted Fe-Mo cluster-binding NifX family protein